MTSEDNIKEPMFYIVATPIGNKGDLSTRAITVLKSVDVIACEDSRTSAKLLDAYHIDTKLVSYHKFNEKQRTSEILKMIEQGKKIALISDAGTPCISDPGRILVQDLYEKGVKITSVPGACAVVTFLSMIPRNTEEFAFTGFLPRVKSQQSAIFDKFKHTDMVFYESANRLLETLENVALTRGAVTKVAVGRELTKMFEETKVGTVCEVIEYYKNNTLKGEIVCMVYADEQTDSDDADIEQKVKKLKTLNLSDKDISQIISALYDVNKNKVYKISLGLK